ncbi:aminotransferase class III-fold pyridoxal phosphate-dependent enzyme [Acidithiobacillus sp. AMEEHan]|uniref:aspartate aminotransferase family protein n=1 Tax=Acidithiobacillus sp. AMEEHan TaxID=2994951 RepID=UPI0027E40E86|nr:aminotransferase class III-fold pyridoxal phosphate-dependent enzyme [Acidithiobacillus sp. AMEEHan]
MLKLNSYNVIPGGSGPEFVSRRRAVLSHKYELFYDKPLVPSAASGPWIFDADGKRYLDAYNNVVSVGHGNPRVVEAIGSQSATLCTHTRYVNDELCRLVERLSSKHAIGEWRGILTCSGSEANDLALRIAMEFTGGDTFIVTDHAYHGLTAMTQSLTTSMAGYSRLADRLGVRVLRVPAPVSHQDGANDFLLGIEDALHACESNGHRIAGAIFDSFFTSDGLSIMPFGFLTKAIDMIHEYGGIYIADEVQPGFGRSGTHFWGFQVHDADPDIITMGKPMGNGYPTAGLLLKSYLDDYIPDSYFNTFGGNNVAVAAAHAVLDEIEENELMSNARKQSLIIETGFRDVAKRFPHLSDIRIIGLSVGVDIISDDGLPDAQGALRIVDAMKELGVLISTSGKMGNTLKIRPLLIYNNEESLFLVEQLDRAARRVLT